MAEQPIAENLVEVRDLAVEFVTGEQVQRVVEGVTFDIRKGETLALVGESGSGKSVTAHSILRLLPYPLARHPQGQILFHGQDLLKADEKAMRKIRGNRIAMVFQEPMTSLNPLHTVGKQINEVLEIHKGLRGKAATARTLELLELVGIPEPRKRIRAYPHELSGGQRQRVVIAMALANEPELLIADEPTTALDVTIQAQILELIDKLRQQNDMSVLLVTHDMGVAADLADRVVVMYAGRVVEDASPTDIFIQPHHPYTEGLLACIPPITGQRQEWLPAIPGSVPDPSKLPGGCAFNPRCGSATDRCFTQDPPLMTIGEGQAACWNPRNVAVDRLPLLEGAQA